MSNYVAGIVVLGLADLILFVISFAIYRGDTIKTHRGLPPLYAVGLAAGALFCHFIALYIAAALTQDRFTVLALTCLFGLFPALLYTLILRDAFSDRAINIIMGSEDGLDRVDLTRAREYAIKGDLENARRAYQEFARQYPHSPEPLFGLESVYMLEQRFEDAVAVCRDIMRRFDADPVTRRRAGERLADLLEHHLADPDGAAAVRADVLAPPAAGIPAAAGRARSGGRAEAPRPQRSRPFTLETARQAARRGDVDMAVEAYESFYKLNPAHPRPIFEAATALENSGQYQRALSCLQRIARDFDEVPEHWGAANLRQATIHENCLHDVDTARRVLKQVRDRLMRSEHGRIAADRLAALSPDAEA